MSCVCVCVTVAVQASYKWKVGRAISLHYRNPGGWGKLCTSYAGTLGSRTTIPRSARRVYPGSSLTLCPVSQGRPRRVGRTGGWATGGRRQRTGDKWEEWETEEGLEMDCSSPGDCLL